MITCIVRNQRDRDSNVGLSRSKVFALQGGLCFYCSKPLDPLGTNKCTRDHLFPRKKKFLLRGNMVIACGKCNSNKSGRNPTIHEILRAYDIIYKHDPENFIVEVRHGKPVIRLTQTTDSV